MQMEDCFKKNGKAASCLCFQEKKLVCVLFYEEVSGKKESNLHWQFNTKHTSQPFRKAKKYPRIKKKTLMAAECAHERHNAKHCVTLSNTFTRWSASKHKGCILGSMRRLLHAETILNVISSTPQKDTQ